MTRTFGKYELVDRLGRGGMADVWRARISGPEGFSRLLVIKRILPHLVVNEHARQLFEREARVASRLSHANIVKVYEFGEIEGEYYLAMEHIAGRDLAALIRAGGASPGLSAFVLREVCRALAYAHALQDEEGTPLRILHRDVSPSNIMIGYDGSVRLLDFGIAKALNDPRDKRSVKGTIRGKCGYLAPEVFEGKEPDSRVDQFAAGVVLHETLVGKRLFRARTDLETVALVTNAPIPTPSSLNPSVPPLLDAACMRALDRDRNRRYPDCDSMALDLDQVAHDLRFGPTQLSELMARLFPRGSEQMWTPEDSGPLTVAESPSVGVGLGTARAVEFMDDRAAQLPAPREERVTAPGRKIVRPPDTAPTVTSKPHGGRRVGYVVGGLLALAAIVLGLVIGRSLGSKQAVHRAPPADRPR